MDGPPEAPWSTGGECLVAVAHVSPAARRRLPTPLHAAPGPAFVVVEAFDRSPVGPYVALRVAQPARIGARVGLCSTTVAVSSPECRIAGRERWGFPEELATLRWSAPSPFERELVWEERGFTMSGLVHSRAWPFLVPLRSLQNRQDGPAFAGGRAAGWCRWSAVEIGVAPDDDLAWLRGRHRGACVSSLRATLRPARPSAGLLSSLRARRRSPQPDVQPTPS